MEVRMRGAVVLLVLIGLAPPAYGQSFFYARLGHGVVAADRLQGSPAIGFGVRTELDALAVDASFFNWVVGSSYPSGTGVFTGSLLRLQVLRFFNADAERSTYAGAGLSWGVVSVGGSSSNLANAGYRTGWDGSGLQGDVTVGYEFFRNSALRMFVQTDVGLPFFNAVSRTYAAGTMTGTARRYIPSAAVSFGLGWQRRGP
jgi:hypothetical protein